MILLLMIGLIFQASGGGPGKGGGVIVPVANCVIDAVYGNVCSIEGETPVKPAQTDCCWYLKHSSLGGVSCSLNGIAQLEGIPAESSLVMGNAIYTKWLPTDVVLCNYNYILGK